MNTLENKKINNNISNVLELTFLIKYFRDVRFKIEDRRVIYYLLFMFFTYVFFDIFRAHCLVGSVRRIQSAEDQSENRINESVNEGSRR